MHGQNSFKIFVETSDSGKRLDLLIASRIMDCSRSFAASLIRNGMIRVQGSKKKPGYRVREGDKIRGCIPPPEPLSFEPEPIAMDILYEDNDIIVVNKQAGRVVHPAPGHYTGTLVNGLLYHCPELEGIGGKLRPGIVHRLDKDTSGVLVVAKNTKAHHCLADQFKARQIRKKYLALVHGRLKSDSGIISFPVGRHPVDRKKMSIHSHKSRHAETTWKVKERFIPATLIELDLKTGRMHQIRVHCAAIHHPVVGDQTYGGRGIGRKSGLHKDLFRSVSRQMLHARRLELIHPTTRAIVSFDAPIPSDIQDMITTLRQL